MTKKKRQKEDNKRRRIMETLNYFIMQKYNVQNNPLKTNQNPARDYY
jgi:hypothetical protein